MAIHWKKGLSNINGWEGAELPQNLQERGGERAWIKIETKTGPMALGVVYMKTENETKHGEINDEIYQVLDKDFDALGDIPKMLFGDFNGHIGEEDGIGIQGNHKAINHNGKRLLEWVQNRNLKIVNRETRQVDGTEVKVTEGLWTRYGQETQRSVLDYMIVSPTLMPNVIKLAIDDDLEIRVDSDRINSDHTYLLSLVNVDYHKIEWPQMDREKWNPINNQKKFRETLEAKIREKTLKTPGKTLNEEMELIVGALVESGEEVAGKSNGNKMDKDARIPKELWEMQKQMEQREVEKLV